MKKVCSFLVILLISFSLCKAEETKEKSGIIKSYPHMEINLEKNEIRIEAVSSKELLWGESPIEFPLMSVREKAYETLFITQANPLHINLGLILMGLRPAPLPESIFKTVGKPDKYPENMPPLLTFDVEWTEKGKKRTENLRKFVFHQATNKIPDELNFAFTGSFFSKTEDGKSIFVATITGEIASFIQNKQAMLNLPYVEASPYTDGEQPEGFCVNVGSLPSAFVGIKSMEIHGKGMVKRQIIKEIPVTLILRPVKK